MLELLCCYQKNIETDLTKITCNEANSKVLYLETVPEHLIVAIFKKMTPVAFARSYRSSNWVSSIIEHNKTGPRVHLNGHLFLQFQGDNAKMLIKFQSKSKTFKQIYEFDEVLDSLVKCSYFHLKGIWFIALNFDEDFFYLILNHIQKRNMRCTILSVPSCEYVDMAIEVFRPKELCIVGEEPLAVENFSKQALGNLESFQLECQTCEDFSHVTENILPFVKHLKMFISTISDFNLHILKLIEAVQNGKMQLHSLAIEYNLQYNRVFKLSQLVKNTTHSKFEIHFPHGTQTVFFFPISLKKFHLVVSSKVDKKFAMASDLYATISFAVVYDFNQLVEFLRRAGNIESAMDILTKNVDIVNIRKTLFTNVQ